MASGLAAATIRILRSCLLHLRTSARTRPHTATTKSHGIAPYKGSRTTDQVPRLPSFDAGVCTQSRDSNSLGLALPPSSRTASAPVLALVLETALEVLAVALALALAKGSALAWEIALVVLAQA